MTHQEFDKRLDEIAENLQNGARDNRKFSVELATELAEAKAAIKQLLEDEMSEYQAKLLADYEADVSDRVREARMDEMKRIEAANTDNGIIFETSDLSVNNGWKNMRAYTAWRIGELQKELEDD